MGGAQEGEGEPHTRAGQGAGRAPPHQAYLWRPSDLDTNDRISWEGHAQSGRTCWTCHRETLIRRG